MVTVCGDGDNTESQTQECEGGGCSADEGFYCYDMPKIIAYAIDKRL